MSRGRSRRPGGVAWDTLPYDSSGRLLPGTYSIYRQLRPIGWAIHTRDVDSLRAALQAHRLVVSDPPWDGARRQADGETLRWLVLSP